MKYWQKLLTQWREKEKRDGFTIPYIIGSQKYLKNNEYNQNVEDLILDVANENSTDIYIKYCASTGDLILGIRDETKTVIPGKFLKFENGKESNLFLTDFSKNLGNSVEEVALELYDRYQKYIDSEQYSKNGRERGDYEINESDFIKECFK
ncbi:hypothetical protein [Flavobacterium sp. CAN_S2]|uniref:hypothetical protein n=1 Tax=Flavobacterium sp. CAN_S2 TaxID=2787726 RepID=UPI0018CA12BA